MTARSRSVRRITGLETEYGCLVGSAGPRVVTQIRDWVFEARRYGLIDGHQRGWDEPVGNGGFLFNGGRLYLDMSHLEYCTPECSSAAEVVRYDQAGDRLLLAALDALGLREKVSLFRNNIDHHSDATFGCHENYSLLRAAPLTETNVVSLLAFLTLRVLFTGSGRVGQGGRAEDYRVESTKPKAPNEGVDYQISQRADYIENDFYEWVQHNRAIINTRDEPLADPRRYRRLHLLHGDTNVLPAALYLKVGATRLVLDLLEQDALPTVALDDAVGTLRRLSHQAHPPWRIELSDGQAADAVEVLGQFRQRAHKRFKGRDAETDTMLGLWARVESGLATDLTSLVGTIDWVTKQHLLESFRAAEGLEWSDPWLQAQDLEYHQIDPERSLGLSLADLNGPWAGDAVTDDAALLQPPMTTRAGVRSQLMRAVASRGTSSYEIDWDRVEDEEGGLVVLSDPWRTTIEEPKG